MFNIQINICTLYTVYLQNIQRDRLGCLEHRPGSTVANLSVAYLFSTNANFTIDSAEQPLPGQAVRQCSLRLPSLYRASSLGEAEKMPIGVDHLAFDFSPVYVPSGVTGRIRCPDLGS
jgi:hypothetical protein